MYLYTQCRVLCMYFCFLSSEGDSDGVRDDWEGEGGRRPAVGAER